MAIALPTGKTPASNRFEDYVILLYGKANVGKAAFAASAENALFLEVDTGLESLEVARIPIKSWQDFSHAITLLTKEKHNFSPIVIYTGEALQSLCSEHIYEKFKIKHESDLAHGKGWHILGREFDSEMRRLRMLKLGLIIVSHSKEKTKTVGAIETQVIIPSLVGSYAEKICNSAEIAIYCENETLRDEQGRILKVNGMPQYKAVARLDPTPQYDAGDRTRRLTGTHPLNYKKFKTAWEGATPRDPKNI